MPNHTLNVMQIILNLDLAGAQEVVRTLADYLPSGDCTLVVCAFQEGPLRDEIQKLGVKVEILERPRYKVVFLPLFLAEMLRIRRELKRLIETYHIEIAQTHLLEVLDLLVLTLRNTSNLRVVLWTIHNVEFLPTMRQWLLRPKRLVYRLLYRMLAAKVDGFISVSDDVRVSIVRQLGPVQNKIFTIHNGVDVKRYGHPGCKRALCQQLGIESDSVLMATIGRLTEQKGHRYLIDAAARVVPHYPNTHWLFVGDGELRDELQNQVRHAKLTENVHFLGQRRDIPELLAAIDVFVLPSLWEGLSIALLEAMASSRAIVATSVSGTTHAMIPNKTGLIVPPRDVQALADATVQLLSDPARARAMGRAAKRHVERHYSAQKQAEEHLALYRRLLTRSIGSR
jgi:glycosyltransferase involved in cell wall biosynthesis